MAYYKDRPIMRTLVLLQILSALASSAAAFSFQTPLLSPRRTTVVLQEMKRPILDQIASTLFSLETERVEKSSELDSQGRMGEPMAWSEDQSFANKLSEFMATRAYGFKQLVADLVAGDYDQDTTDQLIDELIQPNDVALFSFTTCPFCRRAKDELDERGISYAALELDELPGNEGNEIRAQLGRRTGRTSVPSIFVKGKFVGGCNDGPGLIPLLESGEFESMMQSTSS
jgi:glutaredoxin 3